VSTLTVRVALGRTINMGNFESLRLDVAHEVEVAGDRAAAVAEATSMCRSDLERLIAEESNRRLVAREDIDTLLQTQTGTSEVLNDLSTVIALLNELAQSGSLTPEQLERTLATLKAVSDTDIPF
jgi:hypothetical protein